MTAPPRNPKEVAKHAAKKAAKGAFKLATDTPKIPFLIAHQIDSYVEMEIEAIWEEEEEQEEE